MIIQIASDLHVERLQQQQFRPLVNQITTDADTLVLAGDICNKRSSTILDMFCDRYEYVVYVAGNHEFYRSSFDDTYDFLQETDARLDNLIWLDPLKPPVIVDGYRFLGGTLWFPKNPQTKKLQNGWSDFFAIHSASNNVYSSNELHVEYLTYNMTEGDIVVTHMAPSYRSVGKKYLGDPYNCFFANDLDTMIKTKKPRLWVHGHMHDSVNYRIGDTYILTNPYGYQDYGEGKDFDPSYTINLKEIGEWSF